MLTKSLLVAAAISVVSITDIAGAQTIQFGPGGVKVLPPQQERQYNDRYNNSDRNRQFNNRTAARSEGISEGEAIRIARRSGVADVQSVDRGRRSFEISGLDRRNANILVRVDRQTGDILAVDRW